MTMTDTLSIPTDDFARRAAEVRTSMALGGDALGALLLAVVEATQSLLAVKDLATGRYLYANHRMADLFGRTPEQMVGHIDAQLHEPEQAAVWRTAEVAAVSRNAPYLTEHRVHTAQGRREFRVLRMVLPAAEGAPKAHCGIWTEITADKQRDAQYAAALQQLELAVESAEAVRRQGQETTVRDAVTGVFQNEHFDDQLRRELDLSSREHREFALVSIALDPPNAHAAPSGSEGRTRVCEALGRLLRSNTRAMDGAGRLGVDRFAILLSGVGLATAHGRMEGLRRQCAAQIVVLNGRELSFTVSMGVASFPHTAKTQDDLVAASAHALQVAQDRGGNHVSLAGIRFTPAG